MPQLCLSPTMFPSMWGPNLPKQASEKDIWASNSSSPTTMRERGGNLHWTGMIRWKIVAFPGPRGDSDDVPRTRRSVRVPDVKQFDREIGHFNELNLGLGFASALSGRFSEHFYFLYTKESLSIGNTSAWKQDRRWIESFFYLLFSETMKLCDIFISFSSLIFKL